jgi:glucose-6-phosphate dehydrogenase assembly protein OpcA
VLDQPPYEPVLAAVVGGASDSPSADLMTGWLAQALLCPVTRTRTAAGTGMTSVRLTRRSGDIDLLRPDGAVATLSPPGQPSRRISLGRRALAECLADELHRLDPDEVYAETLTRGLALISPRTATSKTGTPKGESPS